MGRKMADDQTLLTRVMLFDFAEPDALDAWQVVNDGVMGGVSSSRIDSVASGTALFRGVVRLENNGGFASVWAGFRSVDLSTYDGVELRVRGDGRRYGFNLSAQRFNMLVYQAGFDTTSGQWQTVKIPFKALKARAYGQRVPALPLNLRSVGSMSLIISDKQAGLFALEMATIHAYSTQALI